MTQNRFHPFSSMDAIAYLLHLFHSYAYFLYTEMYTKKYNIVLALKQSPLLLIYEMQKTSM